MFNETAVRTAIKTIAGDVRRQYRKLNWNKITQKSLRELDELGLTGMIERGDMAQEIIHEVIKQARQAGGKVVTEGGWNVGGDGYSSSSKTEASPLYLAMNEPEPSPESEKQVGEGGGNPEMRSFDNGVFFVKIEGEKVLVGERILSNNYYMSPRAGSIETRTLWRTASTVEVATAWIAAQMENHKGAMMTPYRKLNGALSQGRYPHIG